MNMITLSPKVNWTKESVYVAQSVGCLPSRKHWV